MRMVCIGLEYGLQPAEFFPKAVGRNYEASKLLAPLSAIQNDFTVFSGLDHAGVSGGHRATHTFLSGIMSDQAKSHPEGNITVDQKAAEFVGAKTRFPSMQLGLGGGGVSWTRNGVKIPPKTSLQSIFDEMFLDTPESTKKQLSDSYKVDGSILDLVMEDAAALKKLGSQNDAEKLDEFFTSIREVEKRIVQSSAWLEKSRPKTDYTLPGRMPDSFYEEVPLFYDMMKLALQTDSTRVVSMGINEWRGSSGLPGVTKGYHDLTHHGHDPTKLKQLSIIETFHTAQLARFLESMKRTQASEDASLLDKTMVLFGSGMGNASSHSTRNLPIILAGGGFEHGEHKTYTASNGEDTPACNLFLSMLQRFGVESDQFGTSTGTLEGLN
ncbi:DUF1552 domain-containing protein [Rubripirellula tenax]|nr:DUF1552 domain-containing protein [Rubripirellula tenax]